MRLRNEGAKAQRLLWASTGTKDPDASDVLYIEGLAAPFTVNTMPEKTLKAFADHGTVGETLPIDGGDAEEVLKAFNDAGHRHRRAGHQAPGGRGGRVRQVLGRAARTRSPRRRPRPRRPVADIRLIVVPYEIGRLRDGVGAGAGAPARARGGRRRSPRAALRVETSVDRARRARRQRDRHELRGHRPGGRGGPLRPVDAGELPVVLSGSCFAAVGVVAGLGEPRPGVVWLDAHGDYNEPETSVYGYLDGMGHGDSGRRRLAGPRRAGPGVQRRSPESAVVHAGGRALRRARAGSARGLGRSSYLDAGLARRPGGRRRGRGRDGRRARAASTCTSTLTCSTPRSARVNRYAAAGGVTRPTALERVVRVLLGDRAGARGLADRLRARGSIRRAVVPADRHEAAGRGRRIAARHSSCKRRPFAAVVLPSAMEGAADRSASSRAQRGHDRGDRRPRRSAVRLRHRASSPGRCCSSPRTST